MGHFVAVNVSNTSLMVGLFKSFSQLLILLNVTKRIEGTFNQFKRRLQGRIK